MTNLFYVQNSTHLLCFKTNNHDFHNQSLRPGDIYYHHKYKKLYMITIHGFIDKFEYFSFNTLLNKKDDIFTTSLFFKTRKLNTYIIQNESTIRFIDTPNVATFTKYDKNYLYIGNLLTSNKESIMKLCQRKLTKEELNELSSDYFYQYVTKTIEKKEEKYIDDYLENILIFMKDISLIDLNRNEKITIKDIRNNLDKYIGDILVSPKVVFKSYQQKDTNEILTPYLEVHGYNQIIYLNPKNKNIFTDNMLYLNEYGEPTLINLKTEKQYTIKTYRNDFIYKGLVDDTMYENVLYPFFEDIEYIYYNKMI